MAAFMVALGRAEKASLVGANTVIPSAEFRVSTRPASLTAPTRDDSTGLLDAAVATGSWAMPMKLPDPLAGTAEQAGPKFMPAAAAGGWDADGAAGAGSLPLLLQPAASRASPARVPTSSRREERRRIAAPFERGDEVPPRGRPGGVPGANGVVGQVTVTTTECQPVAPSGNGGARSCG